MSGDAGFFGPDVVLEPLNDCVSNDMRIAAQVIPDGYIAFIAGLHKTEEGIAALTPAVASRSRTGFASVDVTTDLVCGAVGVQRDLRSVKHPS